MNKQTQPSILDRLKQETAPHHRAVEQLAQADTILNQTLTLTQYSRLITTHYHAHRLIEPQLPTILGAYWANRLQLPRRRRLNALQHDIMQLDLDCGPISQLDFSINTVPQALGAMYVMEGSTLGGAVIFKALKKNKQLNRAAPFHYYHLCGQNTRALWLNFCQSVIELTTPTDQADAIIIAAQNTFNVYRRLLLV
ncbi:MAG: biliverdin-producing heme oxygenase [Anaerolineae bacterium]|nr:biliverdin-producing heme oxygenase [Anaerolineae bacterium]